MVNFVLASTLVAVVAGHGAMTYPPTRNMGILDRAGSCSHVSEGIRPEDGFCRWFSQGCQPGCSECTDTFDRNPCKTPMAPTIMDKSLMTWNHGNTAPGTGSILDITRHNPWRSPGFAPVFSPCGLAGGGTVLHPTNGALAPPGVSQGFDGRSLPPLEDVETIWSAGSVQEVAWAITANHGGGYAYRLCPKSAELTEDCFQRHHLKFASSQSWIQYGSNRANRTAIPAHRVSVGTNPAGSQWTKNPIPACGGPTGGVDEGVRCNQPYMFKEPLPGLHGYGSASCQLLTKTGGRVCTEEQDKRVRDKFSFNIIDTVEVPADLPSGEYMLSFRWDAEQTPQVWAQCGDITVTASQEPTFV